MNLDYITRENRTMCFYFLHVYKIRNSDNSSLVVYSLGSWCPGLFLLKNPMSVKLRKDFKGWPIIFGVLNGTNDGQTDITDEVEVNDIAPLLDFADSVTHDLNARYKDLIFTFFSNYTFLWKFFILFFNIIFYAQFLYK